MVRPAPRHPLFDAAVPLAGGASDYDVLLERIGDKRFVLIGEASHGTHEFYRIRADITLRLIREKGFTAVAVEADWPDALRINRYVQGKSADASPEDALGDFRRFPMWMWRNTVVRDFVQQLRAHNDALGANRTRTGFYGFDLYSLYGSIHAVLDYLRRTDPQAYRSARERYSCFEHFNHDPQLYGAAVNYGDASCEDAVVQQLQEMQRQAAAWVARDGVQAVDEAFFAQQNARLVKDAEAYYRAMYRGRVSSWNLRDTYMADTVDALFNHLQKRDGHGKIVLWAHNSHLGDARATYMAGQGELNLGQLMRQRHEGETYTIGFTTHTGTVTAAHEWEGPGETMEVRPSVPDSYERLFHTMGLERFLVLLGSGDPAVQALKQSRLERAIGVIYRPQTERFSHYFECNLPEQFDAVIHIDETHALQPLDERSAVDQEAAPETYPSGV